MKFGINSWAFALPVNADNLEDFLQWAIDLHLPGDHHVIEVFASADPADLDFARSIRDRAEARGFGVVANGFNPHVDAAGKPTPHLVSDDADERKAAIERACAFVDFAAAVAVRDDPGVLSGPWHARHNHFSGAALSSRESACLVEGLQQVAARAEDKGVFAGIEILNRFETYVINTIDEAMEIIRRVHSPNIGISWDSSHAHIEESDDIVASLVRARDTGHLFHVHLGENNRGEYGTGQIGPRTAEIIATLSESDDRLSLVPELFCRELDAAVHKWIHHEGDRHSAARRSIRYLSKCL